MLLNPDMSQVTSLNRLVTRSLTLTDTQGLIASSLSAHAVGQSGCSGSFGYVRLETNDLAGHCKVTMHTTTTAGPSPPILEHYSSYQMTFV